MCDGGGLTAPWLLKRTLKNIRMMGYRSLGDRAGGKSKTWRLFKKVVLRQRPGVLYKKGQVACKRTSFSTSLGLMM